MKKVNLKNLVWKEDGQYVSLNLNTGISSFGDTKKEALIALQEALELYFEDMSPEKINKIESPDVVSSAYTYA